MMQKIADLIQILDALDLPYCDMRHEVIKREADVLQPIMNGAVDHGFQRSNFCSSEVRNNCLVCAHTSARSQLINDLEALPTDACDPQRLTQWLAELRKLDLAIVLIDYRKNQAEIAHAKQSVVVCGDDCLQAREALQVIAVEIEAIVSEHRGYVDQLVAWRDGVRAGLCYP